MKINYSYNYYLQLIKAISTQILFAFALYTPSAFSQNTMPQITSVTPVSPNAASLGKFGEIPVGYATGIPNITVPIYDIESGDLKLNVSLNYHAGGMRVEEVASWVGMGWNLTAGGVISRQVRGLPDEGANGYFQQASQTKLNQLIQGNISTSDKDDYFHEINDGIYDTQPDIFTYNLNGESGKFYFKPDGGIVSIPYSKNKFSYVANLGWTVIDTHGNIYLFTAAENTLSRVVLNGALQQTSAPNPITSWYLTSIQSPTGNSINFSYEPTNTIFSSNVSQTKYINRITDPTCGSKPTDESYSVNNVSGWRLTGIQFKNGRLKFIKNSQARTDYPTDYALDRVELWDAGNTLLKKYVLHQHYVTGSESRYSATPDEVSRLFLDSVSLFKGTSWLSRYIFDYKLSYNFQSIRSYNQDHWGYFNSASNGYDLVPQSIIQTAFGDYISINGANRNPDNNNQAGIIKSITYPTGGRTEFEFETNTVNNMMPGQDIVTGYDFFTIATDINGSTHYRGSFTITDDLNHSGGTIVSVSINNGGGDCAINASHACPVVTISGPNNYSGNITSGFTRFLPMGTYTVTADLSGVTDQDVINFFYVQFTWLRAASSDVNFKDQVPSGGLRIKKITDYTQNNDKALVKYYTYEDPSSPLKSSGSLLSFPYYEGWLATHTQLPSGYDRSLTYVQNCEYTSLNAASNYPLISMQGTYVGYRYVQEYFGENGEFGKNEYEFTSPETNPDIVNTLFPFPPSTSREWTRGQLLKVKQFKYKGQSTPYQIVSEKTNTYVNNTIDITQGIKLGAREFFNYTIPSQNYEYQQFSTEAGYASLATETVRTYDADDINKFSEQTTTYGYGNNHLLPTSITTSINNNEVKVSKLKYPLDYSGLTGTDGITSGIKNLIDKNIISPVIEKYVQQQTTSNQNTRTLQGTFTSYGIANPLPDVVYATDYSTPLTTFTESSVSGGNIIKSNDYKPQISYVYDNTGNIVQQQKSNDVVYSYVWGYNKAYPVAQVVGEDQGTVSSFINQTVLDDPNSTEDQVKAQLDNLRSGLASAKALVTTFTYKPLVGVTSKTDPSGKTTYYEYDSFGRLKLIRDKDNNIIKKFCYNYAGQPENCN